MDSQLVGGLSSIFPAKILAVGGKENTDTEVTASAISVGKTYMPDHERRMLNWQGPWGNGIIQAVTDIRG